MIVSPTLIVVFCNNDLIFTYLSEIYSATFLPLSKSKVTQCAMEKSESDSNILPSISFMLLLLEIVMMKQREVSS